METNETDTPETDKFSQNLEREIREETKRLREITPLRRSFTREEMEDRAREWMIKTWGQPVEITKKHRTQYYICAGMLSLFISELFPKQP